MAEISAADVKALRERTGLPLMECKKALQETGGDQDAAVKLLREQGTKVQETRLGRETSAGRIAVVATIDPPAGAMVELRCESAPVANSPEFIQFVKDLAQQLHDNPGVTTPDELLKLPSLTEKGQTLGEQKDGMFNRIREVFNLARVLRIDAPCGGYAHHDGSSGALVEVSGGSQEVAKDIAMHIAAMRPTAVSKDDLDPKAIEAERQILLEAARKDGKPENIIAKMVEGRLKNFFAEQCLLEQPFVKDSSVTVGKLASNANMKVIRFVRWEAGKD